MEGSLMMMPPTIVTIYNLCQHNSVESLQSYLQGREYYDVVPKLVHAQQGMWVLMPDDSGWHSADLSLTEHKHRLLVNPQRQYEYFRS
jgi:hypothetical protein